MCFNGGMSGNSGDFSPESNTASLWFLMYISHTTSIISAIRMYIMSRVNTAIMGIRINCIFKSTP